MPPMPPVVVLFICKVALGPVDDNSSFTGWRASEWDMTNGTMHCRRQQVELYDPAVDQGATPQPFNTFHCMQAAMRMGPAFDVAHRDKPWRFWKAACPTPVMNDNGTPNDTRDDILISWKIPECPAREGILECEGDTEI